MEIGVFEFVHSEFNFKRVYSYTFQQIFSVNFSSFLAHNPSINIRPVVIDEINKMISCQDPSMGHAIYECPSYVVEKVHVYDLIKRLIIHIPDKNFKMFRH